MGMFEARKDRFMFLNDLVYLNLADSKATSGVLFSSVRADFKAFILTPAVGYRLVEESPHSMSWAACAIGT